MYIPLIRERVRVRGRGCTLLVMHADYLRQVADLKCDTTIEQPLQDVPFEELFASWESPEVERPAVAQQKAPGVFPEL